jgi:Ca-activated chloride channel homolog
MNFVWPQLLWVSLVIPFLLALYVVLWRRKKKSAVSYASLRLIKEALDGRSNIRRHLSAFLLLLAIAALLMSLGRPVASVMRPAHDRTIILTMDVSLSMRAKDVSPSRIEAAQAAAKEFIAQAPAGVRIGIVAFAGTASVVQGPTENRDDLIAAIDRFQLQRETAIGSGIILSLATLFPDAGFDLNDVLPFPLSPSLPLGNKSEAMFKPVPPGSYASAAVILLTDGQATTGRPPLEAARMAAQRGVRVYTVGIGTPQGDVVNITEGGSWYAILDEATLKAIADVTRAEYFYAGSAADLRRVYETLSARVVLEKKQMEVTALFAALAAILLLLSTTLSFRWFYRPP